MPDVGSFWYCRRGTAEAVRVLEDGSECTFLELNTAPYRAYHERIRKLSRVNFLASYQNAPAIANEWLDVGSHWYNRVNADQVLEIMEGCDWATLTVTVTTLRGPPQLISIGELTRQFVRVFDRSRAPIQTYHWVMGTGVRVPFVDLIEARACAFDMSVRLGVPLRVYRRDSSYWPRENQAFMQAAQRLVDNEGEADTDWMEGDFESTPGNVAPTLAPALMHPDSPRVSSLWDHVTAEESV